MVKWRDDSTIYVALSNRTMTHTIVILCNALTADCYLNTEEHNYEEKGWAVIVSGCFYV